MFLTARVFGIFSYLLSSMFFLMLAKRVKNSQTKIVMMLYLLVLCFMAYFYEPYITSDLYRIRIYVKDCAAMSWGNLFTSIKEGTSGLSSTPAAMIYYKLIGLFDNDGIIAAVSCLIIYGMIFNMLIDYKQRKNISNRTFVFVLFCFMAMDYFMPSIATIRSYLSAVFVAFCIYRENIKHKFNVINILLYILALFFHSIGVALVMFRIVCFMLEKGSSTLMRIFKILVILICAIVATLYLKTYVEQNILKAVGYLKNNIYSYVWEWILCLIQTVIFWIVIKRAKENEIFQSVNELKNYKRLLILSEVALILCNVSFAFLQRWCFFVALIILPVFMQTIEKETIMGNKKTKKLLLYASMIVYILTCSRGYLCSLKFW